MCEKNCLLKTLTRGQEIDLTIDAFEYSGTFTGAHKGIVVVVDPFEYNFIIAKSIVAASPIKKCGEEVKITCEDGIKTLKKLLKSLKNKSVLLQVGPTFLQGVVFGVDDAKLILQTRSAGITSQTQVLLSKITVVLVPLTTVGVKFGDPISLTLVNRSESPATPVVFQ